MNSIQLITLYLILQYKVEGDIITETYRSNEFDLAFARAKQKQGRLADVTDKGFYLLYKA